METIAIVLVLSPLLGAIIAGLFGRRIGRTAAHGAAIAGVAVAFVLSCVLFVHVVMNDAGSMNVTVYQWLVSDGISMEVGFMIDQLTCLMLLVVTFVSLMVHVYTIGYMAEDPGYQRFFSYIALFTFSMLMLVMANNFMQLFFGWEAVGLVSYLLIGFWHGKETAVYANLKAFLVNRVGDFGFLLGIAVVVMYFGSLDYVEVFQAAPQLEHTQIQLIPGWDWSLMTVVCILLFIGAMGKSAQFPLHVWLPDSMEGPTPISALIHAATMVTAGIFMVARMSPLYELSPTALSVVLIIGSITALFMAFLGMVQHDIKRVIAYSTLSQLGYMTAALGASAYSVAVFHLMTHAFFKALLFLAAGSVIMAMHHEQDMRKMGGLWRKLPITYASIWIGSLALMGVAPFAGFFSKDLIIEAIHEASEHGELTGAAFAYFATVLAALITTFYSMRLIFMTFHGKPRMDQHTWDHVKESPWVVTIPLILLAIPSVLSGMMFYHDVGVGYYFGDSIVTGLVGNGDVHEAATEHGMTAFQFMLHGLTEPLPTLLIPLGIFIAWWLYIKKPGQAAQIAQSFKALHVILLDKYGLDRFNEAFFAMGSRRIGRFFWQRSDVMLIDGGIVNGSARLIGRCSGVMRHLQTGYLYHYAFAMFVGVLVMISWFVLVRA